MLLVRLVHAFSIMWNVSFFAIHAILALISLNCPDCDNWNVIPHSCHSRFCNACGVKYAKQLAAKATSFCLDCPHRHIVFTIPEELRNWFRQDRTRLNLLFVASRNTISILTNKSLADKLKKKKLSDTHYIFKDIPIRNEFGMIATLHTFGRDLKWNPHIHCLIPELIYSFKKDKSKILAITIALFVVFGNQFIVMF